MPRFLHPALPQKDFAALILTSETGAEAARRISAEGIALPRTAFCVGDQTARTAQAAGFQTLSAAGDSGALLALVRQQNVSGPLLYLRGHNSRGNLADRLNSAGIETDEAVVYLQDAQSLTAEAVVVLSGQTPVIVPLFSPRTARIFAAQRRGNAPLWIAALSPAVAEAAGDLSPQHIALASQPTAANMIRAIADLLAAGGVA